MMKLIVKFLFILMLMSTRSISAQEAFSVSPDIFEEKLYTDSVGFNSFRLMSSMSNSSTELIELEWLLQDVDKPNEWDLFIADNSQEYFPGILKSPLPIKLQAGATDEFFAAFIIPNETSGCGSFKMSYRYYGTEEIIKTVSYHVSIDEEDCLNTSVVQHTILNLSVFPNPTRDFINLSNIENIQSVDIYNINGSIVKSLKRPSNSKIKFIGLTEGLYLIKATDIFGRVSSFQFINQ